MKPGVHPLGDWLSALIAVVIVLAGFGPTPARAAWQTDPTPEVTAPEVTELAAPPVLEPAWRFLGRSEVTPETTTAAGWLIAVSGLSAAELVPPGDAAATFRSRFTFVANTTVTQTSSRGSVRTTISEGTLTVYLHDGSAPPPVDTDFESFRSDLVVGAYEVELLSSAQRETPELGVVAGRMTLVQTDALNFTLDDQPFRFGHAGAELAASYTGGLLSGGDATTDTQAAFFGMARVSQRADNPSATGDAIVGAGALNDCEQLVAWIERARARLTTAGELRTAALGGENLADDALATAFDTVTALLDEQRADIGPEASAEAARLALTVLNTDARGLELLASASASGNQPAIDQALLILTDADALASRALTTLDDITPACEPSS